jgi:hypothetical protein
MRLIVICTGFFLDVVADYFHLFKNDLVEAANFCQRCTSMAISTGQIKRQVHALNLLAWIQFLHGDHLKGQSYAH